MSRFAIGVDLGGTKVEACLVDETRTILARKRRPSEPGLGRERVVAEETPSQMCSARWEMQYIAPRAVCSTFPAPAYTCRVTRNGIRTSVNFVKSPSRSTR